MKIACPTCGMHYEVDSGSLGRYFRCTECKTLFLGLNAKAVKEPQYVVKEDQHEEAGSENAAQTAEAAAETVAEAAEAAETAEIAENVEMAAEAEAVETTAAEEEVKKIYPEQEDKFLEPVDDDKRYSSKSSFESIKITPMQLFGVVAGFFGLLLLLAVIAVWVAHSRVNSLRMTHAKGDTLHAELRKDIELLKVNLQAAAEANQQLKKSLAVYEAKLAAVEEKLPGRSQMLKLESMSGEAAKVSGLMLEINTLKGRVESLENAKSGRSRRRE